MSTVRKIAQSVFATFAMLFFVLLVSVDDDSEHWFQLAVLMLFGFMINGVIVWLLEEDTIITVIANIVSAFIICVMFFTITFNPKCELAKYGKSVKKRVGGTYSDLFDYCVDRYIITHTK